EPIAAHFGEDRRRRDGQTAKIAFFDGRGRSVDEIPPAVDERMVDRNAKTGDRSLCREALRVGHAQLVTLAWARMANGGGDRPGSDAIEQGFAFCFGEQFGVTHADDASVRWNHHGSDRDRTGPRASPRLVDADDRPLTRRPKPPFDIPAWGSTPKRRAETACHRFGGAPSAPTDGSRPRPKRT